MPVITNGENAVVLAAQVEQMLESFPRGVRAIELLVAGRNIIERIVDKRTITLQEIREHIDAVDFMLGPLERTVATPAAGEG